MKVGEMEDSGFRFESSYFRLNEEQPHKGSRDSQIFKFMGSGGFEPSNAKPTDLQNRPDFPEYPHDNLSRTIKYYYAQLEHGFKKLQGTYELCHPAVWFIKGLGADSGFLCLKIDNLLSISTIFVYLIFFHYSLFNVFG
jgi:hypothetical protein